MSPRKRPAQPLGGSTLGEVLSSRASWKGSAFHDEEDALRLVNLALNCDDRFKADHLADLLRPIAANVLRGEVLPQVVAYWLASTLTQIADFGQAPDDAFGLAPRRGRKRELGKLFTRAALMHALTSWGVSQFEAAETICSHLALAEASEVIKAFGKVRKAWVIEGPVASGRDAGAADFIAGAMVIVHFKATPSAFPSSSVWLSAKFREHVVNSGLFEHIG